MCSLLTRHNATEDEVHRHSNSIDLHALHQGDQLPDLVHLLTARFHRPVRVVLWNMVYVASNLWDNLLHIKPLGIPMFHRSIKWDRDVFAGHSIPQLQINSSNDLGPSSAFLLKPEKVTKHTEVGLDSKT